MVADASFNAQAAAIDAQQTQQQSQQLSSDFNDFLTLLTTQLQNQDPLNPTDSTEFTNQLVQFNQVEQAINTNQKLDNLLQQNFSNTLAYSLDFIGKEITYQSIEVPFDGENPTKISYLLPSDIAEGTVNIRDAEGNLVYSQEAQTGSGLHKLEWDGSRDGGGFAEEGTYTISVDGLDNEGNLVPNILTTVTGVVDGIENQNGLVYLIVGERAVQMQSVINTTSTNSNGGLSDIATDILEDTQDAVDDTTEETAEGENNDENDGGAA